MGILCCVNGIVLVYIFSLDMKLPSIAISKFEKNNAFGFINFSLYFSLTHTILSLSLSLPLLIILLSSLSIALSLLHSCSKIKTHRHRPPSFHYKIQIRKILFIHQKTLWNNRKIILSYENKWQFRHNILNDKMNKQIWPEWMRHQTQKIKFF